MLKSVALFALVATALSASVVASTPASANPVYRPIQSLDETAINIYPDFPVYCVNGDYPVVNQVSRITKLEETDKSVTFTFRTILGACERGSYVLRAGMGNVVVDTHRNVRSAIDVLSPAEAQITLSFDKKTIFKRRDIAKFTMAFYPHYIAPIVTQDVWGRTYYYQPPMYMFPWQVKLTKLAASGCDLEIIAR